MKAAVIELSHASYKILILVADQCEFFESRAKAKINWLAMTAREAET